MKDQYSTNMVGGFILQCEQAFWPHIHFKGRQRAADKEHTASLSSVTGDSVDWDHSYPGHLGQGP